jgi:hypothetical protein
VLQLITLISFGTGVLLLLCVIVQKLESIERLLRENGYRR